MLARRVLWAGGAAGEGAASGALTCSSRSCGPALDSHYVVVRVALGADAASEGGASGAASDGMGAAAGPSSGSAPPRAVGVECASLSGEVVTFGASEEVMRIHEDSLGLI